MTESKFKEMLQHFMEIELGQKGYIADNLIDDYIKHHGQAFIDKPYFTSLEFSREISLPEILIPNKQTMPILVDDREGGV